VDRLPPLTHVLGRLLFYLFARAQGQHESMRSRLEREAEEMALLRWAQVLALRVRFWARRSGSGFQGGLQSWHERDAEQMSLLRWVEGQGAVV
jgi:hypothetical protein